MKPLTTGQLAALLGYSPRAIQNACRAGKIRCWTMPGSRMRRIGQAEVERICKERGIEVPGAAVSRERMIP